MRACEKQGVGRFGEVCATALLSAKASARLGRHRWRLATGGAWRQAVALDGEDAQREAELRVVAGERGVVGGGRFGGGEEGPEKASIGSLVGEERSVALAREWREARRAYL